MRSDPKKIRITTETLEVKMSKGGERSYLSEAVKGEGGGEGDKHMKIILMNSC